MKSFRIPLAIEPFVMIFNNRYYLLKLPDRVEYGSLWFAKILSTAKTP